MTTETHAPPTSEAQEPTARRVPKAARATKAQKASAAPLTVGGTPRADLLPPEVRAAYKGKGVVRMLVILAVMVAVVVAGAVGFATIGSITSQAVLQLERDRSLDLLARQLDYTEARQIANEVDAAIAARAVGTATEIDWRAYLDEVSSTLPDGVSLTKLVITPVVASEGGGEGAAIAENPLQQAAVATITITATSVTVPDVEAWFDDLAGITGFAGIAPPATVAGSPAAGYVVGLQLLVNDEAYLLRFQNDEEK
ncbi:hypothetical protein GCM10007382_10210 [Salinibacterium xinjiangense]|uniref:Tfp pilus assembly protein PilN n=1 Tax=Salinibacterium xinjiangense TaxID=386302 RepID=A0A2C8Z7U5_9MICO|nr:hypothetical protein [Salinibacterium xinjiangense]GGK91998.1 hypothetical protein GCM10007382_10210 [Salinibacterium xinjiangense]SOE59898.1 hypothetical protein SAMN06296378_1008 [Salinibacterium xinjiangense]